jgi:hypothetical protein
MFAEALEAMVVGVAVMFAIGLVLLVLAFWRR